MARFFLGILVLLSLCVSHACFAAAVPPGQVALSLLGVSAGSTAAMRVSYGGGDAVAAQFDLELPPSVTVLGDCTLNPALSDMHIFQHAMPSASIPDATDLRVIVLSFSPTVAVMPADWIVECPFATTETARIPCSAALSPAQLAGEPIRPAEMPTCDGGALVVVSSANAPCCGDTNDDGEISVDELVACINAALVGCQ